jgi:hypothetical protein
MLIRNFSSTFDKLIKGDEKEPIYAPSHEKQVQRIIQKKKPMTSQEFRMDA